MSPFLGQFWLGNYFLQVKLMPKTSIKALSDKNLEGNGSPIFRNFGSLKFGRMGVDR